MKSMQKEWEGRKRNESLIPEILTPIMFDEKRKFKKNLIRKNKKVLISFRCDKLIIDELDKFASKHKVDRTYIIKNALVKYLGGEYKYKLNW